MGLSFWQIALVILLFLLLFGRGRIPQLMGDLATGIRSFKQGLNEESGLKNHGGDAISPESPSEHPDRRDSESA